MTESQERENWMPDVDWKLAREGSTWRIIEEGTPPKSLGELKQVLSYCERIPRWKTEPIRRGIHLLIKDIVKMSRDMSEVEGKLIWKNLEVSCYQNFQWMVITYIDRSDGTKEILRQKNTTQTISE